MGPKRFEVRTERTASSASMPSELARSSGYIGVMRSSRCFPRRISRAKRGKLDLDGTDLAARRREERAVDDAQGVGTDDGRDELSSRIERQGPAAELVRECAPRSDGWQASVRSSHEMESSRRKSGDPRSRSSSSESEKLGVNHSA